MKYLVRHTTKHPTRIHRLASDGIHSLCRHAAGIEAGKRGWQVKEYEPKWNEICWHCNRAMIMREIRNVSI